VERPDRVQREPILLAPVKELVTGPCISQPGIPVSDGGREEFNIGIGSTGAGCGNQVGDPGRSRTAGNNTAKMVVVYGCRLQLNRRPKMGSSPSESTI
jgi:hypothetical protein